MLIQSLLMFFMSALSVIFSWLPAVTTLPTIGGYDIDTALVQGVGQAYTFANDIWPIYDVFLGAAFVWGYYALKLVARLIMGHRAPGSHN
jgi:hypothetical protein